MATKPHRLDLSLTQQADHAWSLVIRLQATAGRPQTLVVDGLRPSDVSKVLGRLLPLVTGYPWWSWTKSRVGGYNAGKRLVEDGYSVKGRWTVPKNMHQDESMF